MTRSGILKSCIDDPTATLSHAGGPPFLYLSAINNQPINKRYLEHIAVNVLLLIHLLSLSLSTETNTNQSSVGVFTSLRVGGKSYQNVLTAGLFLFSFMERNVIIP